MIHKEISIDNDFSVYHLVERVQEKSTLLNHRRTMSLISNEIENATLVDDAQTVIFSGFQYLSKFISEVPRYRKLAKKAKAVYVFGVDDVIPPDIENVIYVPLSPNHQLTKEWFLVSYGHDYFSALATEELTNITDPDETRVFKGIWSFDLQFVTILYEWLCGIVGLRPMLLDKSAHDYQHHIQLMSNTMSRMLLRIMAEQNAQNAAIVQGELKTLVKDSIQPAISRLTQENNTSNTEEQDVVVMFSDIRNFSAIAGQMEPHEIVKHVINPYLDVASRAVYQNGGMVDKFLGDGVLAVFGLNAKPGDNPAQQAVQASQEILEKLRRIYPSQPPVGIGVAQGKAFVGRIGSDVRSEETVIGDVVNLAQRLSSIGVNDIWVSQPVYNSLPSVPANPVRLNLKGMSSPQPAYRLSVPGDDVD